MLKIGDGFIINDVMRNIDFNLTDEASSGKDVYSLVKGIAFPSTIKNSVITDDSGREYRFSGISGYAVIYDNDAREFISEDSFNKSFSEDIGEISDGYHTFNELYKFRMLYNAAFLNLFVRQGGIAYKSRKHNGGEEIFGGKYFIVVANLPSGQISNHYENGYWDLFDVPELPEAEKFDGHTPNDVIDRLGEYLSYSKLSKNKNKPTMFLVEVFDKGEVPNKLGFYESGEEARRALETVKYSTGRIVAMAEGLDYKLVKSSGPVVEKGKSYKLHYPTGDSVETVINIYLFTGCAVLAVGHEDGPIEFVSLDNFYNLL